MNPPTPSLQPKGRLGSLDVFRGITMFLLVAEGSFLYHALTDVAAPDTALGAFFLQFHHHPWHGLRFWDLIQPFFMFIVGVAMAISIPKRWARGDSWRKSFWHILSRCAILMALGVSLHIGYKKEMVWELWNVLSQLSFTVLVAFLLFKLPIRTQLIASFGLILLSEVLYRSFSVEGFDQPFVQGHSFGAWMDMVLMGKINPDGWVAINALPTAAHTIWGVLAGKVLMSERSQLEKVKVLALAGVIALLVGYGLDIAGITPIIKRICTSSFVIATGGWCLVTLAFLYWLVDIRGFKRWTTFFTIVGLNPIFIYIFSETLGQQWFNGFVAIFMHGTLGWVGAPEGAVLVITALAVLGLEWALCYWLYQRRIFIKI